MNFRVLTLKYMGWCPGVKAAARFMPDRDIPEIYLIGSTLAVILVGIYYSNLMPPPVWEPKVVYIDGIEYPDEYFNEDFDYASLKGKKVVFHQPFNRSEFLMGDSQIEEFSISELDELEGILDELGTPKIVVGYALWIGSSTWEEVARWRYGDSVNLNEIIGTRIWRTFGDYSNVNYEVERRGQSLYISKYYRESETHRSAIWSIEVSCNSPYLGTIFRRGLRRWIGG